MKAMRITALILAACLLLGLGAIASGESGLNVYCVDGQWYTETQYQSLFGGEGAEEVRSADDTGQWDTAGTALLTLSDSRNDEQYAGDLDVLKVDYAVIDGEILEGNTWDGGEAIGSLDGIVTNNTGALVTQDGEDITLDFADYAAVGGSTTAVLGGNPTA